MSLGRCSGSPFFIWFNSRLRQTCRRRLAGVRLSYSLLCCVYIGNSFQPSPRLNSSGAVPAFPISCGFASRRRWGVCFGLVLISAAPPLPWSGLVPLVRSAVRCSFGVHRAPLPALVCSVERPAVRCCPLRFVLYVCIVKRFLYKVKR